MDYNKAKRLAAKILKVGTTKIWVSPTAGERLKEAMTNDDVRSLIKDRIVMKRKDAGQSRGGARILLAKRLKGRKRGKGKRTGTKKTRTGNREIWIKNVRAQRKTLKELKLQGTTFKKSARHMYLLIKGNFFKGKKHLLSMVEEGDKK